MATKKKIEKSKTKVIKGRMAYIPPVKEEPDERPRNKNGTWKKSR